MSNAAAPAPTPEVAIPVKPDHLVWKPVRLERIDWREVDRARVVSTATEHIIYSLFVPEDGGPTDLEACDTFLLSDVGVGKSVLGGIRTSGYWSYGVVEGWEEGKYFKFDGPNEGSLLWHDLLLLRGPAVDAIVEEYQERRRALNEWLATAEDGDCTPPGLGCPMKRTDSGTNYGFSGRPDYDFWTRSGYRPWYMVGPEDYHSYNRAELCPKRLRERAEGLRGVLASGREDGSLTDKDCQAIRNQIEDMEAEAARASAASSREPSPKAGV
jgi:hypothetical protein